MQKHLWIFVKQPISKQLEHTFKTSIDMKIGVPAEIKDDESRVSATPETSEIKAISTGIVLIGLLKLYNLPQLNALALQGITAFALEAPPRNNRTQSMDVLSSQANVLS